MFPKRHHFPLDLCLPSSECFVNTLLYALINCIKQASFSEISGDFFKYSSHKSTKGAPLISLETFMGFVVVVFQKM